jgi:hypothetical protein
MNKAIVNRLGAYQYPEVDIDMARLIERGPIEAENGIIYIGSWTKVGMRQARGKQLWPDGSVYEGYW